MATKEFVTLALIIAFIISIIIILNRQAMVGSLLKKTI